jgi:TetR/AcrR family transcriptional regulator
MSKVESTGVGELPYAARMRGDERREQLITVALRLFARKGFNGTTTKEIAALAGVTEALIFRHFPTKEALYDAILKWRLDSAGAGEFLNRLRDLAELRDDEALVRTLFDSVLSFHRENPDFQRLMLFSALEGHNLADSYREDFVKPLHDFLVEYIARRQAEGAFKKIDPTWAVRGLIFLPLHHSLVTNLFKCSAHEASNEEAVEQFTRMILDGLRVHDGGTETE